MWIGLADEEGRSWYGISSEVEIDPSTNDFISGVFRLITPDEPRMSRAQIAAAVVDFCGDVDEFWAWIPTVERFAEWFGLGDEASRGVRQVLGRRSSDASRPGESLARWLAQPLARSQRGCGGCWSRDSTQGSEPPSSPCPRRMESATVRTHSRVAQPLNVLIPQEKSSRLSRMLTN